MHTQTEVIIRVVGEAGCQPTDDDLRTDRGELAGRLQPLRRARKQPDRRSTQTRATSQFGLSGANQHDGLQEKTGDRA